jgi:N-acetylneuraminate synthase
VKLNNDTEIENYGKPYFIAELNTSHFGNIETAKQMIDEAMASGCDCVKFQSWSAGTLYSNTYYRQNPVAKRFVDKFSFGPEQLKELSKYAHDRGISFASTPYSRDEVDFLLKHCSVPFIKIASMEINNYSYLEYVAKTGTAIILSTGMADQQEITRAVDCIVDAGNKNLCILHCVSIYPAEPETINLNNIKMLRKLHPELPIGYSDHTIGAATPIAAVALGAAIIEKHFTLDAKKIGMDNQMAMEPENFRSMIADCNTAWRSLGSAKRMVSEAELLQRANMRRSIVSKRTIPAGAVIEIGDIEFKRPGDGFSPAEIDLVVGKIAAQEIASDEVIYPASISQ